MLESNTSERPSMELVCSMINVELDSCNESMEGRANVLVDRSAKSISQSFSTETESTMMSHD